MDIGVIGYGTVGMTTADVARRLGHAVKVKDVELSRMNAAHAEGYGYLEQGANVDIAFLCVPESNLRAALASAPDSPVTVIRSTVPPGTTDHLSEELGRRLAHMPEFLREATALSDALNPDFILIGCHDQHLGQCLADLFSPLLAPVFIVPPTTSEIVKLALNAYLHTLVSFWNEIHMIAEHAGVQSHLVGKLCSFDPRVPTYGATMHGKPVGGRCLPKDIAQLIAFAEAMGHEPQLLKAVEALNNELIRKGDGKGPFNTISTRIVGSRCQSDRLCNHRLRLNTYKATAPSIQE